MKNTGPLESILINTPISANIGNRKISANPLANISNTRLIVKKTFFLTILHPPYLFNIFIHI